MSEETLISKDQIIIADDSAFILQQLSQIFVAQGYSIANTASNGQEAVESYTQYHPHVKFVTLDITMPVMDGITALEKILQIDPHAIVIMISSLGTEALVKKSLLIGARGYILKPLNKNKVLERVSQIIAEADKNPTTQ